MSIASISIVFLEYTNFKDDSIEQKCLRYNKSYRLKLDEKLKERFFNTYKFSNLDNNRFILSLGVYPYKNIWMIGRNLVKYH